MAMQGNTIEEKSYKSEEIIMKKRILIMLAVLTVSAGVMTGCSRETKQDAGNGAQSGETAEESGAAENETVENGAAENETTGNETVESGEPGNTEEDASEVTGTLDEIKDFMFVVTDDAGMSYAFSFEERPKDLDQVAVGDRVTVKYTGTISEVDAFTGEILSIEKQS